MKGRSRMSIWRGMGSVESVEGVGISVGILVHGGTSARGEDDDVASRMGLRDCCCPSSPSSQVQERVVGGSGGSENAGVNYCAGRCSGVAGCLCCLVAAAAVAVVGGAGACG